MIYKLYKYFKKWVDNQKRKLLSIRRKSLTTICTRLSYYLYCICFQICTQVISILLVVIIIDNQGVATILFVQIISYLCYTSIYKSLDVGLKLESYSIYLDVLVLNLVIEVFINVKLRLEHFIQIIFITCIWSFRGTYFKSFYLFVGVGLPILNMLMTVRGWRRRKKRRRRFNLANIL